MRLRGDRDVRGVDVSVFCSAVTQGNVWVLKRDTLKERRLMTIKFKSLMTVILDIEVFNQMLCCSCSLAVWIVRLSSALYVEVDLCKPDAFLFSSSTVCISNHLFRGCYLEYYTSLQPCSNVCHPRIIPNIHL